MGKNILKKISCILIIISLFYSCKNVNDLIEQDKFNEANLYIEKLNESQKKDAYYKMADKLYAKGNYARSADYYLKADLKSEVNKIMQKFLDSKEYDLYGKYYLLCNEKIILNDEFTNNSSGWWTVKDDKHLFEIKNGKAYFEYPIDKGSYITWLSTINLDVDKDFKIESRIKKVKGDDDHIYALVWGLKDAKNYYRFGIGGSKYDYQKTENDKSEELIDWTKSSFIKEKNSENSIYILKKGNMIDFYINDSLLKEMPFNSFFGNRIGFLVGPNVLIEIENFKITQYPNIADAYIKIADYAFNIEDYDTAIQYYNNAGMKNRLEEISLKCIKENKIDTATKALKAAGFNDKYLYLKIADIFYKNKDFVQSLSYCNKAGFGIEKELTYNILNEEFNDNKNGWDLKKNEDSSVDIKNSKLFFEYNKEKGSYYKWIKNVIINQDLDFKIECALKKVNGLENNAFNIIWGMKDIENHYSFGISDNGYYLYGKWENNKWINLIDWKESDVINRNSKENKLAVIKTNDVLKFYINDCYVDTAPFSLFYGDNLGFSLFTKLLIEIDSLNIKQFAPEVVVNLVLESPKDSKNINYLKKIASYYYEKKLYDISSELYEKIGDKNNFNMCLTKIGDGYLYKKEYEKAFEYYTKAENNDKIKSFYMVMANEYFDKGNYEKAIENYSKINDNVDAYLGLAETYLKLNQPIKANEIFVKIANIYYSQDKLELANDYYKKASSNDHLNKVAAKYFSLNNFNKALDLYKMTNNLTGQNNCYTKIADDYYSKGYFDDAKENYLKANKPDKVKECEKKISTMPINSGLWEGSGLTFVVSKDCKEITNMKLLSGPDSYGLYTVLLINSEIKIKNKSFEIIQSNPRIKINGKFTSNNTVTGLINDKIEWNAKHKK